MTMVNVDDDGVSTFHHFVKESSLHKHIQMAFMFLPLKNFLPIQDNILLKMIIFLLSMIWYFMHSFFLNLIRWNGNENGNGNGSGMRWIELYEMT